jgi:Ca2+-binding RTX toxin-like protein
MGQDRIVSSGDLDKLSGGAGADELIARSRAFMWGGRGRDTLRVVSEFGVTLGLRGDGDSVHLSPTSYSVWLGYRRAPGPVVVDLRAGYGQLVGSNVRDEFVSLASATDLFIVVFGTSGNDTLLGTDLDRGDVLSGERGDDELRGRDGPDSLSGGPGRDVLDGGEGSDRGSGGPGADTCTDIENLFDC